MHEETPCLFSGAQSSFFFFFEEHITIKKKKHTANLEKNFWSMLQFCSFNVSILTVIIYFMYAHECFASVYVFVPGVCVSLVPVEKRWN